MTRGEEFPFGVVPHCDCSSTYLFIFSHFYLSGSATIGQDMVCDETNAIIEQDMVCKEASTTNIQNHDHGSATDGQDLVYNEPTTIKEEDMMICDETSTTEEQGMTYDKTSTCITGGHDMVHDKVSITDKFSKD